MVTRILSLIAERGLTPYAVEKALGFGNGAIKRFDKSSPSVDKIVSLCNFLDVSTDYVLTGKTPEQCHPNKEEARTHQHITYNDNTSADFAQRLSVIMQEKGVTAYKIGIETNGITEAMVGKWKNGNSLPSFDKICILSDYLGVSCDYLLTGSPTNQTFSDEEYDIIEQFRNCNDEGKELIKKVMNSINTSHRKLI